MCIRDSHIAAPAYDFSCIYLRWSETHVPLSSYLSRSYSSSSSQELSLIHICLLDGAELPESMRPAWYAQLAAYLLASGVLDTAVMLTEGPDADAYLGMERTRGYACMNGSASCDIALFDLTSDEERRARVTVRDRELFVYDATAQQFADRLNKVFKLRRKWAKRENVSAYRVYDADLPDYNMAIDLYEGAGKDAGRRLVHVAEYAPPKSCLLYTSRCV